MECCLDIGYHIISSEGLGAPRTYAEAFEVLAENGVVPSDFLPTLLKMVRFRNRLVHLYWELDEQSLYEILQHNLGDFDAYARYVTEYMATRES